MTGWDATKTYKQMVVLFEFTDSAFHREDVRAAYDKIFNQTGYNEGQGAGCVADYFRDQSGGLLNLSFDVYGPVKVSGKAQPYDAPTKDTRNYGRTQMEEATRKVLEANPGVDYSQYDWNGDGTIEQVIFVYAGPGGNKSQELCYGHIWPNTSSFSTITTPDGKKIYNYTCSAELWQANSRRSCGIGTICHEFTHSLGLPDIYPVGNDLPKSTVDEWDLMDGGNFTNLGWCPPNFSPLEKMLMGWLQPVELTEATSVTALKPAAEGGTVYQVKHTANEYLLLENRQWNGWDKGLPGKGLVVYQVDYAASAWSGNRVNSFKEENNFRYKIVHADNILYDDWVDLAVSRGVTSLNQLYKNTGRLNSMLLSTSSYPWSTDSTTFVNNELTDTSVPATIMHNNNSAGVKLLGKPITNIQMSEDGLVSFDFMGGTTGIKNVNLNGNGNVNGNDFQSVYDLSGRLVFNGNGNVNGNGVYLVRDKNGKVRKVVSRGTR
jgi:M6 family metalloprotease-like protein